MYIEKTTSMCTVDTGNSIYRDRQFEIDSWPPCHRKTNFKWSDQSWCGHVGHGDRFKYQTFTEVVDHWLDSTLANTQSATHTHIFLLIRAGAQGQEVLGEAQEVLDHSRQTTSWEGQPRRSRSQVPTLLPRVRFESYFPFLSGFKYGSVSHKLHFCTLCGKTPIITMATVCCLTTWLC